MAIDELCDDILHIIKNYMNINEFIKLRKISPKLRKFTINELSKKKYWLIKSTCNINNLFTHIIVNNLQINKNNLYIYVNTIKCIICNDNNIKYINISSSRSFYQLPLIIDVNVDGYCDNCIRFKNLYNYDLFNSGIKLKIELSIWNFYCNY